MDSRRLCCRTSEQWFGGEFSVKWSGFGPESQSYGPKVGVTGPIVRVTAGQTPRIRPESPRKGSRIGFKCFYREPPLRAFLNPARLCSNFVPNGIVGIFFKFRGKRPPGLIQHVLTVLVFWFLKNLLMPLFLGCFFPLDFQEVKRPLRIKSGKCPIQVGKLPIKEGKRPIKVMVLVGISVGCLMGCFWAPPP